MRAVRSIVEPSLEYFKKYAFEAAHPARLTHECLSPSYPSRMPAIIKWFSESSEFGSTVSKTFTLNGDYLSNYGSIHVPVEMTRSVTALGAAKNGDEPVHEFMKNEIPLSTFVALCDNTSVKDRDLDDERFYLAQCPISILPKELQADVPTPELALRAGLGDIYESSIWIGRSSYTSLHKDPNPNLFVQLAGRKTVRLAEPLLGRAMFDEARRRVGRGGSAAIRGEEMMQGKEKEILEEMVWGKENEAVLAEMYDVTLDTGDGLFIPKGWWHSVRGIGGGISGSVSTPCYNSPSKLLTCV